MRLAFLILAHRDAAQLLRLVRRLDGPEHTFVIHLDAKCGGPEWEAAIRELRASNVLWAERVDCSWGEFSVVEATLNAIRALTQSEAPFDFAVLLSGQDYPIKSNEYIAQALAQEQDNCLMYLFPFPFVEWRWRGYHRLPVKRIHLFGRDRRVLPVHFSRFVHRRVPGGLHLYGGSQWWGLPHHAVHYIDDFVSTHPEFVAYFRDVQIPDEIFVHTLLGNSPFPIAAGRNDPHYIRWTAGPHPDVLGEEDLSVLRESKKLFARKFEWPHAAKLLDRIDQECAARVCEFSRRFD